MTNSNPSATEPLYGFVPRKVKGDAVRKALDHNLNPFTKVPHTAQYKKILEARKKLPVFAQMDEFLEVVRVQFTLRQIFCSCLLQFNKNQVIVMVGETGSGKTTQSVSLPFCGVLSLTEQ
jgi:pre-mRNA-splicing factor ATP-dependent RNA helicase DHX15/PRP43